MPEINFLVNRGINSGNTSITGFANASVSVNSALFTVGTSFIANTIGVYSTGVVNAASHTVGTLFVANSTALALSPNSTLTYAGVTLTNTVTGTGSLVLASGPTLTGTTTTAVLNSGNTTITGFANASVSVNSALLTVGTAFIANTTGVYSTGLINASSYNIGTLFVANTTALALSPNSTLTYAGVKLTNTVTGTGSLVLAAGPTFTGTTTAAVLNTGNTTITGFANVSVSVNSAVYTSGTSFIANTTGVYSTGTVNAASYTVGTSFTANSTAVVTPNTVTVGTASYFLSNGNVGIANSTASHKLSVAGFINSLGYIDTVTALGNSGTAANVSITNGGVFTATLTGDCTFTLQNPSSSGATAFILILTNDATPNRTVAWAGGTFKYPGGSVTRTTAASAVDIWYFMTPNGGTTWYVSIPMANLS